MLLRWAEMNADLSSALPLARAAFENVRSNAGRAKVLFIGDSTTAGVGAGMGWRASRSARPHAFPAVAANLLNDFGIPATAGATFSDGGTREAAYDPTISLGAGWEAKGSLSAGGQMWFNSTTDEALTVAPVRAISRCDVWYADMGNCDFSVCFDGQAETIVTPQQTFSLKKVSIEASAGKHKIRIRRIKPTGGLTIGMIDCYNTSRHEISIWNAGISGSSTITWIRAHQEWGPLPSIAAYSPDLTFINLGLNDETLQTSYEVFYENMFKIVNTSKTSGDVILILHHAAEGHDNLQKVTIQTLEQLSRDFMIPILNFQAQDESWQSATELGKRSGRKHCTALGYAEQGAIVANLIRSLYQNEM